MNSSLEPCSVVLALACGQPEHVGLRSSRGPQHRCQAVHWHMLSHARSAGLQAAPGMLWINMPREQLPGAEADGLCSTAEGLTAWNAAVGEYRGPKPSAAEAAGEQAGVAGGNLPTMGLRRGGPAALASRVRLWWPHSLLIMLSMRAYCQSSRTNSALHAAG
jgi:hypothetical protein